MARLFCSFAAALASAGASPALDFASLEVDGRQVDVWVPPCAQQKAPIILSLHAWGSTKDAQKSIDSLPAYEGPECAIVAYPQGKSRGELFGATGFSWNAGGCCPNANTDKVDDVGFLNHVISAVAQEFNGNEQAAFVVGLSNGGMMANRLACASERVRAVVAVSGPLVQGTGNESERFECSRSVPMLHLHGEEDTVVPYNGCKHSDSRFKLCKSTATLRGFPPLPWPSVPASVADWRARNGAGSEDTGTITFSRGGTTCTSWGESANNVTLCKIRGEGHAWPGSCSVAAILPGMHCTHDIDGSLQAMEFFRRYMPRASIVV